LASAILRFETTVARVLRAAKEALLQESVYLLKEPMKKGCLENFLIE